MSRRSTQTADQIFEAEKAADDRKQTRKSGFSMADVRDAGHHRLSNDVVIRWRSPKDSLPLEEGEVRSSPPPEDGFYLHFLVDGKEHTVPFNGDEFRRWLRWV